MAEAVSGMSFSRLIDLAFFGCSFSKIQLYSVAHSGYPKMHIVSLIEWTCSYNCGARIIFSYVNNLSTSSLGTLPCPTFCPFHHICISKSNHG